MKKYLTILLLTISVGVYAQPSLSSFTNSTQRAQLIDYSRWMANRISDSVKNTITAALVPVTKTNADSLSKFSTLYKALQASGSNTDKVLASVKISLDSSIKADAITITSLTKIVNTIQGSYSTSTEVKNLQTAIADLSAKQSANIDLSNTIKMWMDKVKTANQ